MRPAIIIGVLSLSVLAVAAPKAPPPRTDGAAMPDDAVHAMATGQLTIRVEQGTKGGPAIGADMVTVELHTQGRMPRTIPTRLDKNGVVIIKDLPTMRPFHPVVTVHHAGVSYQVTGKRVDMIHPHQEITVTVYETTEQEPNWDVRMWHVIVHPSPEGFHVTEMIFAHNPTDRAWLSAPDSNGLRRSLALQLPDGAVAIKRGKALSPEHSQIIDGKIISTAPMLPGKSEYHLTYTLPTSEGKARITITPPAPVRMMLAYVPDDGTTVEPEGLKLGTPMGGRRAYQATSMPAGKEVVLTLGQPPRRDSPGRARTLVIIGGVMLLILGIVVVLRKPRNTQQSKST